MRSSIRIAQCSLAPGFVERLDDMRAASAYAAARWPQVPVVAAGHRPETLIPGTRGGAFNLALLRDPSVVAVLAACRRARSRADLPARLRDDASAGVAEHRRPGLGAGLDHRSGQTLATAPKRDSHWREAARLAARPLQVSGRRPVPQRAHVGGLTPPGPRPAGPARRRPPVPPRSPGPAAAPHRPAPRPARCPG